MDVIGVGGINVGLDDSSVIELVDDLENLQASFLSRMSQYLKVQLRKKGISVFENTYTGFDTEYKIHKQEKCLNQLISVQTAIRRRLIVKVPMYKSFDISFVHPLTNEIADVFQSHVGLVDRSKYKFRPDFECSGGAGSFLYRSGRRRKKSNELLIVNNSLKHIVSNIRKLLFHNVDETNTSIINALKSVKNIEFFEDSKNDQLVFILPLTPLSKEVRYPSVIDGFSLEDLLEMARDKSKLVDFSEFFLNSCTCSIFYPFSKELKGFRGGSSSALCRDSFCGVMCGGHLNGIHTVPFATSEAHVSRVLHTKFQPEFTRSVSEDFNAIVYLLFKECSLSFDSLKILK